MVFSSLGNGTKEKARFAVNGDAQLRHRQQLLPSLKSRPREYDFCNATGATTSKGHSLGLVFYLSAMGGIPLKPTITASENLFLPLQVIPENGHINSCPAFAHNTQIGKQTFS